MAQLPRSRDPRPLAAAGLAAMAAMLAAGLFEYNFGDSEFLMLFLVLVTLPFAADRGRRAAVTVSDAAVQLPPLDRARGLALLDAARDVHVVVVGDVMLDQFIVGRVNRISPEAPVPVVEFDRDEFRLGGAANVAHNVARARRPGRRSIGVVGDDDGRGRRCAACSRRRASPPSALVVDPSRPTTRKTRLVTTRNQQVARIDYERDGDVDRRVEDALVAALDAAAARRRRHRRVRLPEGRRHARGS